MAEKTEEEKKIVGISLHVTPAEKKEWFAFAKSQHYSFHGLIRKAIEEMQKKVKRENGTEQPASHATKTP